MLTAALFVTPCAADDAASPVLAYYDMIHSYSVGEIELALAQFSETAVVIAGPQCTDENPCVGRAAIRENYLVASKARGLAPPLLDQRFDGTRLTTRGEVVGGYRFEGTVKRLMGGHVFEFREGRIVSLRVELDPGDAQTAAFIAQRAKRGGADRVAIGAR